MDSAISDYIMNECKKYSTKSDKMTVYSTAETCETPQFYKTAEVIWLSKTICAETENDGRIINLLLRRLDEARFEQLRLLKENETLRKLLHEQKVNSMIEQSAIII